MQAETKAVLIKDIVTLQEHDAPDGRGARRDSCKYADTS
jgi:hypothetical protein